MSAISVNNNDAFVYMRVQHAPKEMFVREAVKNALESIGTHDGQILIGRCDPSFVWEVGDEAERHFDETTNRNKLFIANDAPNGGLSLNELQEATNIASTIGKEQGLDDNFGQGIKLTGLASNEFGFLWISRQGSKKHLVWLRFDKSTNSYIRHEFYETMLDARGDNSDFTDVLNISNIEIPELDKEFTGDYNAYIFLGDRPKQDTASNPFGNKDGKKSGGWLPNMLYRRFFDIPDNVAIRTSVHSQGANAGYMHFIPKKNIFALDKYTDKGVRSETVEIGNGFKVHYYYDPYLGSKGNENALVTAKGYNISTTGTFSGYVYKGEIYDVKKGMAWKNAARQVGIPYGASNLSVFVEIPKGPWRPDSDRRHIEHTDSSKTHISLIDYDNLIKDNRPDWVIKIIEDSIPKYSSDSLNALLKSIYENYSKYDVGSKKSDIPGLSSYKSKNESSGQLLLDVKNDIDKEKKPHKRRSNVSSTIDMPKLIEYRTEEEVVNGSEGLKFKFAAFSRLNNHLEINFRYLQQYLENFLSQGKKDSKLSDHLDSAVTQEFEQTAVAEVFKAVMTALIKEKDTNFTVKDFETATSMAAMTNQADCILNDPAFAERIENLIEKEEKLFKQAKLTVVDS